MESSLNERIKTLIYHFSKSVNAFAKEYDIAQRTLAQNIKEGRDPRTTFLLKLINLFPDINLYWLLKGEGEMFRKSELLSYEIPEVAAIISEAGDDYGSTIERLMKLIEDLKEENKALREDNKRKNKVIDGLLKEKEGGE